MEAILREIDQRQFFKQFNKFMLMMWRLGLGQWINIWPEGIGRIMVIANTGRKSGLQRYTPVNYAVLDGEVYCISGWGKTSDWFCNVMAHPEVEIWLPEGWWAGVAEEVTDPGQRLALMRTVSQNSGFAAYAFGGFDPKTVTDEKLAEATRDSCVLHIRRTEARTGPGGPGDLAWVWPLATFMLLPMALRGKRRRKR